MFTWKNKLNMSKAKQKLIETKISTLIDSAIEKGADIFNAPNSDQYFIVDSENKVNIGVEQCRIRVSNHNYTYNETLSLSYVEKTKEKIRGALEARVQELKKNLFKNEIDLLNKLNEIYKS